MTRPIYLLLHFRETKKAIAAHIKAYNEKLRKEQPREYKALKIKAPVIQTVNTLLYAYSKFLHNNKKQGLTNPVFKINNKAIYTMLNGLRSEATIWRHIKRATDAGVLDKGQYVFHGSNSSFELGFNPSILVACQSEEFSSLLLKTYNQNVENPPISVNISVEMLATRPLFADSFNGCMVSFCKHIVPVQPLQEQNINMDKASHVDKSESTVPAAHVKNDCSGPIPQSFKIVNIAEGQPTAYAIGKNKNTEQEQGSCDTPRAKTIVQAAFKALEERTKQEQVAPAKSPRLVENSQNELIRFYTERSLIIALRVLYPDRIFEEADLFTAQQHIRKYFLRTDKKVGQLYNDFQLVIYEAYKSKFRNHYIPAPIIKYFDSQFAGGFYSTLVHVETYVKPYMEKNADFKKSLNDLVKLHNRHQQNPGDFEQYRKAAQLLGKKRNKTFLNFFNACVTNAATLNAESIQHLFQRNVTS